MRGKRALAGFTLAQISVGNYPYKPQLSPATNYLGGAYFEQLPKILFAAAADRQSLEAFTQDTTKPASERFHAGLILKALDNLGPSESDWVLAKDTDAWLWLLTLCPEKELAAVQSRLEKDPALSLYRQNSAVKTFLGDEYGE